MNPPDPEYLGFSLWNGALVATSELKLSPLSTGFMYGEGLFETIRVSEGQPQLLERHHARLAGSMQSWGANIDCSTVSELRARCVQLTEANALSNGSLKLIVFRDTAGWSELILARAATYPAVKYETGFRLQTVRCDARTNPLYGRKSLNYLANIQAKRAAAAAGYDEPLFVDPTGQVLEGATTNLFLVKSGILQTPPLSAHILPGVMRAYVMSQHAVLERPLQRAEFREADEVFVTNALLGVMPVSAIDEITYDLTANALTRALLRSRSGSR